MESKDEGIAREDDGDGIYARYQDLLEQETDVAGALRAHASLASYAIANHALVTHRVAGDRLSQRLRNIELERVLIEGVIARRFKEGRASLTGGNKNIDID